MKGYIRIAALLFGALQHALGKIDSRNAGSAGLHRNGMSSRPASEVQHLKAAQVPEEILSQWCFQDRQRIRILVINQSPLIVTFAGCDNFGFNAWVVLLGRHDQDGVAAAGISSLMMKNFFSLAEPKFVVRATSAASRPRAMTMRPMRGTLWRASKVNQRPPR